MLFVAIHYKIYKLGEKREYLFKNIEEEIPNQ